MQVDALEERILLAADLRIDLSADEGVATEVSFNEILAGEQTFAGPSGRQAAVTAAGEVVAVYASENGDNAEVVLRRAATDGSQAADEQILTDAGRQSRPAVAAANEDGRFAVAWQSEGQDGSGWGVYLQPFTIAGIPDGDPRLVNTTTAGNQELPALAYLTDGSLVVTWTGNGPSGTHEVFGRRFDLAGNAVGGEFQLAGSGGGPTTNASVAATGGGGFAAVWQQATGAGDRVFVRFFGTGATPLSDALEVDAGNARLPQLTGTDTGAIVTWQRTGAGGQTEVIARQFTPAGSAGAEILVDGDTGTANAFAVPTLAEDGRLAVAWAGADSTDAAGVFVREFDADGNATGDERRLNSLTDGIQQFPEVVAVDGEFLGMWSGVGPDDAGGVFVRSLDAMETPEPPEPVYVEDARGVIETGIETPGPAGETVQVTFNWDGREAGYRNSFGVYLLDAPDGTVGGLRPGDAGYTAAALAEGQRVEIFRASQDAGASLTVTLATDSYYGVYMIQDADVETFLAVNPNNDSSTRPQAFVGFAAANPGGYDHLRKSGQGFRWEDMTFGGDEDFDDMVLSVSFDRPLAGEGERQRASGLPFTTPGTADDTITADFTWMSTDAGYRHEMGVYAVDDPSGTVNGLSPGDAGYAEAALRSETRQVIFPRGGNVGEVTTASLRGGTTYGTYLIQDATTEQFLADNPANAGGNDGLALFGFNAANPGGGEQVRERSAGVYERSAGVYEWEDLVGGDADFNDLVFNAVFALPTEEPPTPPEEPEVPDGPQSADPVLHPVGDQFVNAGETLQLLATAGDPDRRGASLFYEFIGDTPDGLLVDRQTGVLNWTPAPDLATAQFDVTLRVIDEEDPPRFDEETFTIFVAGADRPVNTAPVFKPLADVTITEVEELVLDLSATDPDGDSLTYSLGTAAPPTMTLDAVTGELRWSPTEADGPGVFDIPLTVTDAGSPSLSTNATLRVTVTEVNMAPVLSAIGHRTVVAGGPLTFTASATDGDLPANVLTFSLEDDAPDGATIDPATGAVSWTPPADFAPGIITMTVRVTDDAPAPLFATQVAEIEVLAQPDVICEFPDDLAGWTVTESGGTLDPGSVTAMDCVATLREGDLFTVTLEREFAALAEPSRFVVEFDDPLFDDSDTGFINDAFEIALLDADGQPLTFGFEDGRDAFFNLTEDVGARVARGVAVTGNRVEIAAPNVPEGTPLTLVMRLVNDDADTESTVTVRSARLEAGTPGDDSSAADTKFFVPDASGTTFRYDPAGATRGSFDDLGAGTATGATSDAAGSAVWTIHDGGVITVTTPAGVQDGRWTATDVVAPAGIATDGTDIWIASATGIHFYDNAASRTTGSITADSVLSLDAANTDPTGLATDGDVLWVTDDTADAVFVYDTSGTALGSWTLDAANTDAVGITNEPGGGDSLWVVDAADNAVYQYAAATAIRTGDLSTTTTFALAATNTAPTGIADPPGDPGIPLPTRLEWSWESSDVEPNSLNVMNTPAVIDLNQDGTPDVVFGSTASGGGRLVEVGVLRALDGVTGSELFTVTDQDWHINTAASLAVGDIDDDGLPEIVANDSTGRFLVAFEHDGTPKWRSEELETRFDWGAVALADLGGDGRVEIVAGRQVFDAQGTEVWTGLGGSGRANQGSLSVVVDVDQDGSLDVLAGNTAYSADGSIIWQSSLPDGLVAVGNFDEDIAPEIVLVTGGQVAVLENNGEVKWQGVSLPGGGIGGAPTVADFDGDGEAEIGVAGARRYVVLDTDGSVLWAAPTQDTSSNVTGSSVFDFDDDGFAEVVYRDERTFRVYDGRDGTVRFQDLLSSCTWHEYVVVADVDGDGEAEIVATANNNCGKGPQRGIFVYGSDGDPWSETRPLWNQHSYHITNINDDGTIPANEAASWLVYNNYRRNRQTTGTEIGPPTIQASAPTDELAAGRQVVISGQAFGGALIRGDDEGEPIPIISVTVDGRQVDVLDANGQFFAVVDVLPGENEFELVATDEAGQTAATSVSVFGTTSEADVDLSQFADVTGSFSGVYGRTSWREDAKQLYVDLATRNDG